MFGFEVDFDVDQIHIGSTKVWILYLPEPTRLTTPCMRLIHDVVGNEEECLKL